MKSLSDKSAAGLAAETNQPGKASVVQDKGLAYRSGQALGVGAVGLGAAALIAGGPIVWAITAVFMISAKK